MSNQTENSKAALHPILLQGVGKAAYERLQTKMIGPGGVQWEALTHGEHSAWEEMALSLVQDGAMLERARPNERLALLEGELKQIAERYEKETGTQHGSRLLDRIVGILSDMRSIAVNALEQQQRFRGDCLVWFKAMEMTLSMTDNASTHREKSARLRGAIELCQSAVRRLNEMEFAFTTGWKRDFPDIFRSDCPTRGYVDRIHELERQIAELVKNAARPEDPADPFGASSVEPLDLTERGGEPCP